MRVFLNNDLFDLTILKNVWILRKPDFNPTNNFIRILSFNMSVVNRLVVILFSVRNVRGGFIVVVHCYQCCVRPVLLYCCETWELTVADEMKLRGVERRMIRMMCGVRLVDRVSTDLLRDRVGVVVKIEDFIIQRRLRWYGDVIRRDTSSQIREVMEHEITWKRKKGRPRKSWEECIKKDLERYGLRREDAYDRVKWREHIKAKIANPGQPG